MLNQLIFDPAYILIIQGIFSAILFLLLIVALCKIRSLKKKYRLFMTGKDGASLEEVLETQLKDVMQAKEILIQDQQKISGVEEIVQKCYQKSAIVHYDAFNNIKGKSSFVIAFLNSKNDGILLNSIHTREGNYLYLKEVLNGQSEVALGKEENEALQQAIADSVR
jgi:hypothetical protein